MSNGLLVIGIFFFIVFMVAESVIMINFAENVTKHSDYEEI